MMFKATFLAGLILASTFLSVFAQAPDPRDSVMIEQKDIIYDCINCDSITYIIRVMITNRDSLGGVMLPIQEKTLSGGAYLILAYPRNFGGVVQPLTATLGAQTIFSGDGYNSVSPDTLVLAGFYDSLNPATAEPPNPIRNVFWEIKFDSILASEYFGQMELDSVFIDPDTSVGFFDLRGNKIGVNFIKSRMNFCFVTCGDTFPTSLGGSESKNLPREFYLSQNYPNPFNANTQISFALPKSGHATLAVFNLLGQKVSTLIDGYLTAGTKIVNWDGRDDYGMPVPSGVYFYQLRSSGFKETKKMLVLK